ncbi:MAG: tetratricopeptide repeat protein [Pseudomonadota bacterium]
MEGDFGSINGIIEDYQAVYEADPARELHAVVPYRQFIDAAYLKDKRNVIEARLEEWEHHSVESFAPYMAMCSYSYGLASQTRGNDRIRNLVDLRLHCGHAIKLNPKAPYAYGRLVKAARMNKERKEADRWLRRGLSVLPESYFVRSAYQSLLSPRHGGSNEEMLAFAEQAQRHADSNPMLVRLISDAHDNIGNQHSRNDDYLKAITSYSKSLEFYVWGNPLISLAASYSAMGENDLAINALTRAMEVRDSYYLYKRRARVYSDAGRFEEALADIETALAAEPDNTDFLRTRANILYKMEDYAAALAVYETLVEVGSATAWDWRRIAYIKQRKIIDIEAAERSYIRALALEPSSNWAWHEFATLLYNKKDSRAPAAFQTYLDICATGKECDPVLVDRSKKFVACVNSEPECSLSTEEYRDWLPGA